MALVEFTQQFAYVNPNGTVQFALLQSTPGVYIIKGMNCYSTTGIVSPGVQLLSSATSGGSSESNIFIANATTANYEILPIFNPAKQIILTQPYIRSLWHIPAGTGTCVLNISYSFIPTSNVNFGRFNNLITSVAGGTGASFTGLSANVATIIKSILIVNTSTTLSTTITLILNGVLFELFSLPVSSTYVCPIPLFINSSQTLTVGSTSTDAVQVIYSYTQDLN
jgi:hypothetical protein